MSDPPRPPPRDLQRRLDEAEGRARDLAVLNAFAATLLHHQSDIDDILWDVANQAVARLNLEDCVIYLLDERRELLFQRAAYGPKNPRGREILAPITIPMGQGVVGAVAATGKTVRIADTRLDPRYICDDQMRLSELAVPLIIEGQVIGVIDSEHSQADFFTAWHEDLFTTIASMTASRVARSRVDDQLRALNQTLEARVVARTAELAQAHRRSEDLLGNLLPARIAARLKAGETRIAERVGEAAVLFADLEGFTRFAASAAPEQVIALLEAFFNTFDRVCAAAGAEKIKTVGDAYMVALGAPTPCQDPLLRMADLALRLRDSVPEIRRQVRLPLDVRFGLASGPVVAGVIGQARLVYDLWGDTVNLASRLESTGAAGRIHLTAAAAARLGPRYQVSAPRTLELKGLGQVETCFLQGRR